MTHNTDYYIVYYWQSDVKPQIMQKDIGMFHDKNKAIDFVFSLPTDGSRWEIMEDGERSYQNSPSFVITAGQHYAVRIERRNLFQ